MQTLWDTLYLSRQWKSQQACMRISVCACVTVYVYACACMSHPDNATKEPVLRCCVCKAEATNRAIEWISREKRGETDWKRGKIKWKWKHKCTKNTEKYLYGTVKCKRFQSISDENTKIPPNVFISFKRPPLIPCGLLTVNLSGTTVSASSVFTMWSESMLVWVLLLCHTDPKSLPLQGAKAAWSWLTPSWFQSLADRWLCRSLIMLGWR